MIDLTKQERKLLNQNEMQLWRDTLNTTKFVFLFSLVFFLCSCNLCKNTTLKEELLNDKKSKIYLFERNAGATTPFSLQITIQNKNKKLSNKSGNICVVVVVV